MTTHPTDLNGSSHTQIYSMIVAAGRGSRFGSSLPKQYLNLNEHTLLEHSVSRLASSQYIDKCWIVIAEDDEHVHTLSFPIPIDLVIGGAERWQSVRAGLEAVILAGAGVNDLIVIHDAARPAVTSNDINLVIEAALAEPNGAILATQVVDTLKIQSTKIQSKPLAITPVGDDLADNILPSQAYIEGTLDRQWLWQAQTPQVFRVGKLNEALDIVATKGIMITDEASAFEALSLPIRLVKGSRSNIKLTYPEDLELLKAIISSQSKAG